MAQANFRVVLVGSLYGGNVGSACRAMANMGVSDLALVAPEVTNWREAEVMACHAGDILARRKTFDTLAEAVSDCVAIVGTTVRRGLYRQHAKSPREWAPRLAALSEHGPVALVFGREDQGLFNEEVALCTHLVQIPTDESYNSLNLSQAVLLLCYELFMVQGQFEPVHEKSELAPGSLRLQLASMWRQMLLQIGFMEPEKADHMMAGVQRIFSRGALTKDDVNIMLGVARQTLWASDTAKRDSGRIGNTKQSDNEPEG